MKKLIKRIAEFLVNSPHTGDQTMKELIKRIAESIVDNPDRVSVKEIQGDNLVVYELEVAEPDKGKIIGKKGRNILAIRTILSSVAGKSRKNVRLELVE